MPGLRLEAVVHWRGSRDGRGSMRERWAFGIFLLPAASDAKTSGRFLKYIQRGGSVRLGHKGSNLGVNPSP